jgi:high-affinity nickel permease
LPGVAGAPSALPNVCALGFKIIWRQFRQVFKDQAVDLRASILGVYFILFGLNLAAWAWAFAAFYSHPVLLGLIDDQFSFSGWFWDIVRSLNDNFGTIGYLIIGLFVVSWFLSLLIYRIKGYDKVVVNS